MIEVYGIKNCSSMKKAFDWLDSHALNYQFHDYKKQGVSPQAIFLWVEALGLETVLNKRGTTWRKLSDEDKARADDTAQACQLMSEYPSLIKRPIVVANLPEGPVYMAGYVPERYEELWS